MILIIVIALKSMSKELSILIIGYNGKLNFLITFIQILLILINQSMEL